jgi:TRAP-type C4-dicarboxylate transport system permease small subunit
MTGRLERAFLAFNRWLLIALLAAMAVIVFANVCLRYLTTESLVWAEEVARHLMIWLTFLGAGLVLRYGGHIAIENLQDALPAPAARLVRAAVCAGMLLFFASMIWFGAVYVDRTMLQTTSATQIPFGYVYLAMPLGFAFLAVHLLLIARDYIRARAFRGSADFDASMSQSL